MIWNTLLIRKALTKAVTKANPRSTLRNVPMIVSSCDLLSSISSWRVITSVPGGSIASIRACTSAGSAPSSTAMSTASNWSGAPRNCCAVGMSQAASVAPAKPSLSPRPTRAVISNGLVPVSVMTWIVSPTAKSSRSAVALSMATSPAPLGGRPSPLICSPDSDESPDQATPSVGAPWVAIGSPSGSMSCA